MERTSAVLFKNLRDGMERLNIFLSSNLIFLTNFNPKQKQLFVLCAGEEEEEEKE